MSVPVPLDRLREQIERFGPCPYVVTADADGRRPRAAVDGAGRVEPGRDVLHVTSSRRAP